jgi:Spy/CpxP family protein refolding chaperone
MKRLLSLGFVAALVAGAAIASAQPPGGGGPMGAMHGPWMMHDHGTRLDAALNLTDEQKAAVQTLRDDLATKSAPLIAQLHQRMQEVHTLLAGDNPDPTDLGQKMIAAHAIEKQLEALHDGFDASFRALLTPDQQTTFDNLKSRFGRHRMGPPGPDAGPDGGADS